MNSLKGHLLVATAQLLDPNFARTVLLMFDHTEEGAAGVVLNRPTEATITDISEQVFEERFEWEKPINLGGPVPGPLMVVHSLEELSDRDLVPGIYGTLDAVKIQKLLRRRPEPCLVVANYAGWGPGQLESEIAEDSWLSLPATDKHIFWVGAKDLWESVLTEIGQKNLASILRLRAMPEDPSRN
jgi:putative transcriptional regulator